MATTYTYTISTETANDAVADNKLEDEINADSGLAAKVLEGLFANRNTDVLSIVFTTALSAGEETTLDGIVLAHDGVLPPAERIVAISEPFDVVEAGVSKVVANGFLAIECQDGITGFAATQMMWPLDNNPTGNLCVRMKFIMKASGTGSNIRLAVKSKAQSTGEDSSAAFAPEGFLAVAINYTTVGEVFEGMLQLDGSGFNLNDAVGLQIGRDGNDEMGAGTSDDANQPIQIIATEVVAT